MNIPALGPFPWMLGPDPATPHAGTPRHPDPSTAADLSKLQAGLSRQTLQRPQQQDLTEHSRDCARSTGPPSESGRSSLTETGEGFLRTQVAAHTAELDPDFECHALSKRACHAHHDHAVTEQNRTITKQSGCTNPDIELNPYVAPFTGVGISYGQSDSSRGRSTTTPGADRQYRVRE